MFHKESISHDLLTLIYQLQSIEELKYFRLAGGTGLALQIGHRRSFDIDLFTDKPVDREGIQHVISKNFPYAEAGLKTGFGIVFNIHNIKVDLCYDGGKFIRPVIIKENIKMASKEDIAAMKAGAIAERAAKKDFYDIAFLLSEYKLKEFVRFYQERYPFMDKRNIIEAFKKHDKADEDINPVLLKKISWKQVKKKIDESFDEFMKEARTLKEKKIQERIQKAENLIRQKKK